MAVQFFGVVSNDDNVIQIHSCSLKAGDCDVRKLLEDNRDSLDAKRKSCVLKETTVAVDG
jgi:hypothetical protein